MLRVLSSLITIIMATTLWSTDSKAGLITLSTESGRSFRDTTPLGTFNNGFGGFEDPNWVLNASPGRSAWRTAVEFDLSIIPMSTEIVSAEAGFFFHTITPNPISVIEVHGFAGDGVVRHADILGDNLLGTISLPGIHNPVPFVERNIDITHFVNDLIDSDDTWLGLSLRIGSDLASLSNQNAFIWSGFEYSVNGNGPQLTIITKVPEPDASGVLLVGLAIFCCVYVLGSRRKLL